VSALFGRPRIEHLDRYIARRQFDRALAAIQAELARRPDQPNLLLRRAEVLALSGQTEAAVAAYRELARRFAGEGFYAKAIALYKKILRLDPTQEGIEGELARLIEEDRRSRRPLAERLAQAHAAPAPGGGEAAEAAERYRRELEASALFAAFSSEALPDVLRSTTLRVFPEGATVVREGDPGSSLFLIVEGTVSVTTTGEDGEPIHLADLGPGDFFGEVSLLTGRPRTATIAATAPLTLIELRREDVERIAGRHPEVREVLDSFCRRRAEETVEAVIRRLRAGDG